MKEIIVSENDVTILCFHVNADFEGLSASIGYFRKIIGNCISIHVSNACSAVADFSVLAGTSSSVGSGG